VLKQTRWRVAIRVAVCAWLAFMLRLMIADVWDETNGMIFFSDPARSYRELAVFVLTSSISFWRPLPTLIAAMVLHVLPDFQWSWRVLRGINIALLLGAFALLDGALRRWTGSLAPRERFVYAIAALFSGSAVIVAGWYANIFDAAALFILACGLALLARGRPIAAGLAFGAAFFCKEAAALVLPFLLVLFAAEKIRFRDMVRAAAPTFLLGSLYFWLRGRLIPLGGPTDTHRFELDHLVVTMTHIVETFWLQTVKAGPWIPIGAMITVASVLALRRPRLIAAMTAFLASTIFIYWGMFDTLLTDIIDPSNFAGRMYLIPCTLFLFVLALERRTITIALLLVPIVFGAAITYRDHARFQRLYKKIYRSAPLTVDYPIKPLDDSVRGVRIGDIPDAPYRIDPRNARLTVRR